MTSIMRRKRRSGERCLAANKEVANKEVEHKKASKKWIIGCVSKQSAHPNHLILSASWEVEGIQNEHYRIDKQFRSHT